MKARLLIVACSLGVRGASRGLAEVLQMRLTQEFECVVALPPGDGPLVSIMEGLGVRTVRCEQPYWVTPSGVDHWLYSIRRLPQAVADLQKIIAHERIDVVLTISGLTPVGAMASCVMGLPHVWYLQEAFLLPATGLAFPPGQPVLARAVAGLAAKIMVVSEAVRREYAPHAGDLELHVVPSGIDTERFNVARPQPQARRILSVGTTSPSKGLDDLIAAAEVLSHNQNDYIVDVLGDFDSLDYRAKITRRLERQRLTERVRFHGWTEGAADWYAKADIVCCPSHAESFGRSVVEGMAASCAVVATRCGGPEETVIDGETGILVPPHDPQALAAALQTLIASPKTAWAMGNRGRSRAVQLYDLRAAAGQWAAVIKQALDDGVDTRGSRGVTELMLAVMSEAAPRMLLGKKYQTVSRVLDFVRLPIFKA